MTETATSARRIRRISGPSQVQPPPQGTYRGFGSIPGETLEQFHDRMFEIDPLEAALYEMEVELEQR